MQGQRSSMGSLPDTISFDLNPTATDANTDPPLFWNNNIQNYPHDMVPNTNNASTYLNSSTQAQNLSGWNMGESSSSSTQSYSIRNEQNTENGHANPIAGSRVDLNQTVTHMPYFVQSASNNTYPHDLSIGVEVGENGGENVRAPSSASGEYFGEEIYPSEGRRLSCKRKAMEGHIGQSSSSGNSSYFQPREGNNGWNNNTSGWYDSHFGSSNSTALENANRANPQDLLNARLGLSSEIPLPLNMTPNLASSRRNTRVRINSSSQQSPPPSVYPIGNVSGDSNVLTYPPSSLLLPTRTPQSTRWSRGSSSRGGYSLSFGERIARPNEEQPESNRNVQENPIVVPTDESRDSPDWGLARGNSLGINENVARSAHHPISGSSRAPHRTPPRYTRRLSEYVRRSLLSSATLPESGGQNSNSMPLQAGSSSQGAVSSAAGSVHGDRLSRLRSALLLETQIESAFGGGANSSRSVAAGPEGRSRLVSEIRNVLDLMRRGEGLRLEDMVILDQSGFLGMAEMHDRHRDMRLDVDNMSYEELLALEERIGNVNTGLSEETIFDRLKQRKFFSIAMGAQSELEPCCICREDYDDGEDIGTVECGHEFHSGCIKQWLMLKNSCPICKTTALNK